MPLRIIAWLLGCYIDLCLEALVLFSYSYIHLGPYCLRVHGAVEVTMHRVSRPTGKP